MALRMIALLLVLSAVAAQQRPNLPSIYSAEMVARQADGTLLRYHLASDGNEVVSIKTTQTKDFNLTAYDYMFKKNQTRYVIQTNTRFCESKFINETELHQSDPFQKFNQKASGPGDACEDASHRKGHIWTLQDKNFKFVACVSDDGKDLYSLDSTSADGKDNKKWTVTVTASAPEASVLQMVAPCMELTKPLNIPTSYFAQWSKVQKRGGRVGVTEGNVTRQANGDVEYHSSGATRRSSYFVAKDSTLFKVSDWDNDKHNTQICQKDAAKLAVDDFLSSVVGNKFWYATSAHCNGEEGTTWKMAGTNNELCTTSGNDVPVYLKTSHQKVSWISFRTTNLPAFTVPTYCH